MTVCLVLISRRMKIVEKYILISLLFLLPTQLAYHFWPSWSYVFGLRIDMLAPAVYITDILVITLILINFKIYQPFLKYLLFLAVFVIFNISYSISPYESFFKWFKVLEFVVLAIYISKQKIINLDGFIMLLFYSTISISLIGIFQFINNGTIGGFFYWLGERSFNSTTPGIALVNINGLAHLRVYSTFSHPNSLAGYLGVVLLILFSSNSIKKNTYNLVRLGIIGVCFLLTFSFSAHISIFFALLLLFAKRAKKLKLIIQLILLAVILISLLFPIISPWILQSIIPLASNIGERLDLGLIAGKIISEHFLKGIGLGTFIITIPSFKGIYTSSWLLQPVHNIFLLIFTETGITGLLFCCLLIYKLLISQLVNKQIYFISVLVFVLLTGLADHYWLTLQQNQILLSILIGFAMQKPSPLLKLNTEVK